MAQLAVRGGSPVISDPQPWPRHTEAERDRLLGVLDSGRWWATQGNAVREFEKAFGAFQGGPEAVAVTNGTHAIEVSLRAAGIGDGDEVIVPSYTFMATAVAAAAVNAVPVFVDIDPDTLCISPDAVEAAISERTAAVVAVHLAGHPADMDRLPQLCSARGLTLVEDCAHAHGASWRGTPVGMFGAAGTFSFQQSKLMTAGEGGAIVTPDDSLRAELRSFADCGRRPGTWFYYHYVLGGNYRLTEWQAAVLLAQLERFPAEHETRNSNALWLNKALSTLPGVTPQARDDRATAQGYYCYVVRIDGDEFGAPRDAVREALVAEGVQLTMSYPPVHRLDCFSGPQPVGPPHRRSPALPSFDGLDLPHTRAAAAETLWLQHQGLLGDETDTARIAEAFEKVHQHVHELRQ